MINYNKYLPTNQQFIFDLGVFLGEKSKDVEQQLEVLRHKFPDGQSVTRLQGEQEVLNEVVNKIHELIKETK